VKDGITVQNRTRYKTSAVTDFVRRGILAYGDERLKKRCLVVVVNVPGRTRGCARMHGDAMVLGLARPSKWSTKKAALILRHEVAHMRGADHHEMSDDVHWSKGTPSWTRGQLDQPTRKAPHARSERGRRAPGSGLQAKRREGR
jgi:hypothetical protein